MSETRAPYRAEPETMTVEQFHIAQAARMPERELLAQVTRLMRRAGFYVYHTHNSRHSESGWPDISAIRDDTLWLVELKRQKEHLTDAQNRVFWYASAVEQVKVNVWRPSDLLDGTIEEVLK